MFNRLWVRIALIFSLVQLAFILLPFGVFLTLNRFDILGEGSSPRAEFEVIFEDTGITEEQKELIIGRVRREMRSNLPRELIQLVILSGVVGSVAGFLVSRRLTRPLSELEAGARIIGARQLDHRIDTSIGSPEIQVVAEAFNKMAKQLGNAERIRKNLLADVAHELRTPLTVIQGNLRAMLDGVYPMNEEEVSGIFDQTLHLTQLVNDLHELAQAEAHQLTLNIEEINVGELVQACTAAFRPLADEKQIELRPEILGKVSKLLADKTRLAQALHNLISNALQHTPSQGTITIQAEQAADSIIIRVLDTGDGIAAEHLPHVFDRFYRTDKSRQRLNHQSGSGLGLAIVRAVVESHNGEASVDSKGLGKGSTFTIELPLT